MSEVALYSIAQTLLSQGKLLEAKIACLKALNLQPKSATACKLMADIMLAKNQIAAAKYWYDRSLKLDASLAPSHANLGSLYAREKQWELAISCYENAIDIDPNFAGFYRTLAKVWQQVGRQDLMIECWQRAISLEPEKTAAADYLNLADNLLELERKEEAISYYRLAIKLDTSLSKAYQKLGKMLVETGELEEAIAIFSEGISVNPKDYLSYQKLGDIWQKKGRLDEAAICYQKAIAIDPKLFWSYHSLGNILNRQGRWKEAVEIHRQEIALKSDFYRSHYLLGNALSHDLETQKEAFIAYRKAIQLKPEHPWFANYSTLLKFVREQNKLQPLLKLYRRATKLNPDAIWCYVNLGEILTEKGKIEGAIKAYNKACYNKTKKSYPTFVEKSWDFQNHRGPDFLIIGAQKSGTTSLESYIAKHPQVLPAIKKETHFWYRDFDKGIDWYRAHFPPIPSEEDYLTGEATPNYLENCHTAARIYQEFPDVKLLVILRNPADRTISQYYHWTRIKRENLSLEEAINAELEKLSKTEDVTAEKYWKQPGNYVGRGLYVEFLQKWMEVFPREQFLILKGEDLYDSPAATMKQVFDFLALPDYPLSEYKRLNPGYYKLMDDSTRQLLSDYFRPYNQRLEEFLGIKFNWY